MPEQEEIRDMIALEIDKLSISVTKSVNKYLMFVSGIMLTIGGLVWSNSSNTNKALVELGLLKADKKEVITFQKYKSLETQQARYVYYLKPEELKKLEDLLIN